MQLSHEKRLTYRQIYSSEISFGFYLLVLLWVHFPSSDRSTVLCVRRPRLCDGRGVGRASAIDGESTGGRRASAASRVPVNVVRGRPCEVQRVARARLDRPRSGWCARPAASAARWAAARASFFGYPVVCHALCYWYVSVSEREDTLCLARVAFER